MVGFAAVTHARAFVRSAMGGEDDERFYADVAETCGTLRYCVDGAWRASASGSTCETLNPSRGNRRESAFQACSTTEVDEVFACARRAQRSWARTPLHERATLLLSLIHI